jgi:methionyl-tRNA formyltransferase
MNESFGMIFYPSTRSLAYLAAFERSGRLPARIVRMAGSLPHLEDIIAEGKRYDYMNRYFDVSDTPEAFCDRHDIVLDHVDAGMINDELLLEYLAESSIRTWLFTGGGILRKKILSLSKRFIHVHPGRLPKYRGSTTFYYSLLEEGSLHATAFYMSDKIDDGPILTEGAFRINVFIRPNQPYFMDHILDPFVRAKVLERMLVNRHEKIGKRTLKKPAVEACSSYFIIHPVLRLIAISRLNGSFCVESAEGIFIQED